MMILQKLFVKNIYDDGNLFGREEAVCGNRPFCGKDIVILFTIIISLHRWPRRWDMDKAQWNTGSKTEGKC